MYRYTTGSDVFEKQQCETAFRLAHPYLLFLAKRGQQVQTLSESEYSYGFYS